MFTFLSLVVVINNAERIGKTATMAIGCTIVAAKAIHDATYYMANAKVMSHDAELQD